MFTPINTILLKAINKTSSSLFKAAHGFPEFDDSQGQTFVAGYGRRRIPHCMTDDKSPETYEVCARPVWCSHDARTTKCGIKFMYKVILLVSTT